MLHGFCAVSWYRLYCTQLKATPFISLEPFCQSMIGLRKSFLNVGTEVKSQMLA